MICILLSHVSLLLWPTTALSNAYADIRYLWGARTQLLVSWLSVQPLFGASVLGPIDLKAMTELAFRSFLAVMWRQVVSIVHGVNAHELCEASHNSGYVKFRIM